MASINSPAASSAQLPNNLHNAVTEYAKKPSATYLQFTPTTPGGATGLWSCKQMPVVGIPIPLNPKKRFFKQFLQNQRTTLATSVQQDFKGIKIFVSTDIDTGLHHPDIENNIDKIKALFSQQDSAIGDEEEDEDGFIKLPTSAATDFITEITDEMLSSKDELQALKQRCNDLFRKSESLSLSINFEDLGPQLNALADAINKFKTNFIEKDDQFDPDQKEDLKLLIAICEMILIETKTNLLIQGLEEPIFQTSLESIAALLQKESEEVFSEKTICQLTNLITEEILHDSVEIIAENQQLNAFLFTSTNRLESFGQKIAILQQTLTKLLIQITSSSTLFDDSDDFLLQAKFQEKKETYQSFAATTESLKTQILELNISITTFKDQPRLSPFTEEEQAIIVNLQRSLDSHLTRLQTLSESNPVQDLIDYKSRNNERRTILNTNSDVLLDAQKSKLKSPIFSYNAETDTLSITEKKFFEKPIPIQLSSGKLLYCKPEHHDSIKTFLRFAGEVDLPITFSGDTPNAIEAASKEGLLKEEKIIFGAALHALLS